MCVSAIDARSVRSTAKCVLSHPISILLILIGIIIQTGAPPGLAQNYSGLLDKELSPVVDLESIGISVLSTILSGDNLTGDVEKVVVTADAETLLTVQVHYTGFEEAYLRAKVLGSDNKEQAEISEASQSLDGATSPVTLHFSPNDRLAEGDSLESSKLHLLFSTPESRQSGRPFVFNLPKRWLRPMSPENLVVEITPEPIGVAANLDRSDPRVVIPTRKQNFQINKVIDAVRLSPMLRADTARAISTLGPSARPVLIDRSRTADHIQPSTTTPVVMMPARTFRMVELGIKRDDSARGIEGPSNNPISLWGGLRSDVDFEYDAAYKITSIRMDIYPDKNENTGIYYYLPLAYYIKWGEDDGYSISMTFGQAGSGSDSVIISATITPKVSSKDFELIKSMLEAFTGRTGKRFTELRPVYLDADLEVSLPASLNAVYDIQDVDVSVSSSIFEPIQLTFKAELTTKDEMLVALENNVGIHGILELTPAGDMPPQRIPVALLLADERTLGRFKLQPTSWRASQWQNKTPYPVKLRRLHTLLIERQQNIPIIYSWDLGDAQIPPGARATFAATRVPTWLDNYSGTKQIWLDYVVEDCWPCRQNVVYAISRGISASTAYITFESLGILERTGGLVLEVRVRSIQVDPEGQEVRELPPISIRADETSETVGPLHLRTGESAQYEYFLKLITDDEIYLSVDWVASSDDHVYLNKALIEQALGHFPDGSQ